MIFHEIYGYYYRAVEKMIDLAVDGKLTEKEMHRIASEDVFDESVLSIIPAIKQQEWQIFDENLNTPMKQSFKMPLTELQKRWLKTILLDLRIRLFSIPEDSLDDVEPLFDPASIVYFDRYLDGDNYTKSDYIANFHMVMQAIREKRKIQIWYYNSRHKERSGIFAPIRMEYSDKEDKFRVLTLGQKDYNAINMGRIIKGEILDETFDEDMQLRERRRETLVFELNDTRNTLERAMMKFAHYKKQAEKMGENTYRIELEYDVEDETDVLIQIMSFGSAVKVLAPESIREELSLRMKRQLSMLHW